MRYKMMYGLLLLKSVYDTLILEVDALTDNEFKVILKKRINKMQLDKI
jgi:hypothetical protein